jgi:hypothetical protein
MFAQPYSGACNVAVYDHHDILIVIPVWADQFNASMGQAPAERIAVVAFVGNQSFGIFPRLAPAFTLYGDIIQRFLKRSVASFGVAASR